MSKDTKNIGRQLSGKKIAIVADWLIDFGGAELVLSHLLEIFPKADVYTSVSYMRHPMLDGHKVFTSWLQHVPFFNRRHKLSGILRAYAFRNFDFKAYDIVISSSSAEAKSIITNKATLHFCYCHTPTRYYWSHFTEYLNMLEFGLLNPFAKWLLPRIIGRLRKMDYNSAQQVDYFIANSKNTALRIKKFYHRESRVIYPGVEIKKNFIQVKEDFYLYIARCIPYKRFDLLVDAFNKNGKRLILVTNTENKLFMKLRAKSGPNIEWKLNITSEEQDSLYKRAKGFLFPPEEDFGLVPIEAMSFGTPVIAYKGGGALETVVEGVTGIFFSSQTSHALNEAIVKFEEREWDKETIREHAKGFSKEVFQKKISTYIQTHAK